MGMTNEEREPRWILIRQIFDVLGGTITVTEVNDYTIRIVGTGHAIVQVPIGSFLVGHSFDDDFEQTMTFNEDGTINKYVFMAEDELNMDLIAWAESILSGYSDYFNVDGSKKEEFYRLDLKDTSTKVILCVLLFWIICAPIVMIFGVCGTMEKCTNMQKS